MDDDVFAFEVLGVRRLRVGVGRGAQDVVEEVARHLRVLEQHVGVVDRHRGTSDTEREWRGGPANRALNGLNADIPQTRYASSKWKAS